jgi:hypothetical protein
LPPPVWEFTDLELVQSRTMLKASHELINAARVSGVMNRAPFSIARETRRPARRGGSGNVKKPKYNPAGGDGAVLPSAAA